MSAVGGMLATLYERQLTGKGRLGECSLLETAVMDLGAVARRPSEADLPRLAPSLECALPAHAEEGHIFGGGVAGDAFALAPNCGRRSSGPYCF